MKTVYWNGRSKFLILPSLGMFLFLVYLLSGTGKENLDSVQVERNSVRKRSPYLDLTKLGNFEPPPERVSDRPGEGGRPHILPANMSHEMDVSIGKYNGMCLRTSDDISLTRSLPDTRLEECKYWNYPENMGLTASIVIVFHNEGFSTLMRNVQQVLERTPSEMVHEIILVDDCSQFEEDTGRRLEIYLAQFNGKVRLFRNSQREGLIRTRNLGAQKATGDVVVFLDAHCEVNRNWLPPLLAPIYKDRRTMTVPFIDKIDYKTFQYQRAYDGNGLMKGIWEWGLLYKEMGLTAEQTAERRLSSEPYDSPTHAGGLFAIDRKYFEELGYYDDGLEVWGGEQYELSFKIWQCGGKIKWVPCSRVGHVYRGPRPPGFSVPDKCKSRNQDPYVIDKNHKRVIEVWWEPKHREYYYIRQPVALYLDHGDISKQLEFKQNHKCKSFDWFMKHVAPDMLTRFPELPPNVAWGAVKNFGTQTCLDSMNHGPGGNLALSGCHGGTNQLFRLNTAGQLGFGERCIDLQGLKYPRILICEDGKVDGPWRFDKKKLLMVHEKRKHCLAVNPSTYEVVMKKCDSQDRFQQWTWKESRPYER